ncbi:MAG: hypothetical protein ABI635_02330 [Actinomycetota bacterium]
MTDVQGRLGTLIGDLGALGSPIGHYLRPGRTEAHIRATLGALDLAPPAELVDWYAWHDGVDHVAAAPVEGDRSPLEIFFSVTLLSLDEAVSVCDEQREARLELFDDADPEADAFWRDAWFPVLLGPRSIFVVECPTDAIAETGPVWRALGGPGPSMTGIVAEGLAAFLDRLVTEIRVGSVSWDEATKSIQPRQQDERRMYDVGLY